MIWHRTVSIAWMIVSYIPKEARKGKELQECEQNARQHKGLLASFYGILTYHDQRRTRLANQRETSIRQERLIVKQ